MPAKSSSLGKAVFCVSRDFLDVPEEGITCCSELSELQKRESENLNLENILLRAFCVIKCYDVM